MALRIGLSRLRLFDQCWVYCCHPLVYRVQRSEASSSAVAEPVSDAIRSPGEVVGGSLSNTTLNPAEEVEESENAGDEDDTSNTEKAVYLKPPTSHESSSLLYDPLASKFINMLMRDGKKSQAQRVFMESLEYIKRTQIAKVTTGGEENVVINPMKIFHGAIENVKPAVSTESVRRGGRSYHIPCSITEHKRTFLACKWIILSARQKRGIGVAKKLAVDFIDSYNHRGNAIKKKQDLHRLADANRAFTHFRW